MSETDEGDSISGGLWWVQEIPVGYPSHQYSQYDVATILLISQTYIDIPRRDIRNIHTQRNIYIPHITHQWIETYGDNKWNLYAFNTAIVHWFSFVLKKQTQKSSCFDCFLEFSFPGVHLLGDLSPRSTQYSTVFWRTFVNLGWC